MQKKRPQSYNLAYEAPNNKHKIRYHMDRCYEKGEMIINGIEIHQIGELICDPGYEVLEHIQWCHEITCIALGEANVSLDKMELEMQGGSFCFSVNNSLHGIRALTPLRFMYLGFMIHPSKAKTPEDEAFLHRLEAEIKNIKKDVFNNDVLSNLLFYLVDEFFTEMKLSDKAIEYYLYSLMVNLMRSEKSKKRGKDDGQSPQSRLPGVIFQLKRFIEKNYQVTVNVESIAKELGYSKYYISHVFKDYVGDTIQQYMLDIRMHKAQELLRSNHYDVQTIAKILGYSSAQSFSRSFQKYHKVTTKEFQKKEGIM